MASFSFFAVLLLASCAIAESIRQTEVMDRQYCDYEFSGSLPDDEDAGKAIMERQCYSEYGWTSSGDYELAEKTLNRAAKPSVPRVAEQEIPAKKIIALEEETNKVSMASTAQGSIFEKTEVLAVLIAGAAVGLMCSVFLILVIVNQMKKKDEGSYELGKKPIFNKAPTNEIYE